MFAATYRSSPPTVQSSNLASKPVPAQRRALGCGPVALAPADESPCPLPFCPLLFRQVAQRGPIPFPTLHDCSDPLQPLGPARRVDDPDASGCRPRFGQHGNGTHQ